MASGVAGGGETMDDGRLGNGRRGRRREGPDGSAHGGFQPKHRRHHNRQPADPNYVRPLQPKDFLLGGNQRDPLNLASITGPSPSQTPTGSPTVKRPGDEPIAVIIPRSHRDPLNLDDHPVSGRRRHRRRSNRSTALADPSALDIDTNTDNRKEADQQASSSAKPLMSPEKLRRPLLGQPPPARTDDPIVSPVVPRPLFHHRERNQQPRERLHQRRGGGGHPRHQGRQGTNYSRKETSGRGQRKTNEESTQMDVDKAEKDKEALETKKKQNRERFRYGNYNRYYGTRLPDGATEPRLSVLLPAWLKDKAVLDVGCNIGHVTSLLARDFGPARVLGVDIDSSLISVARKNIRHYMDTTRFARTSNASEMETDPGTASASSAFPRNLAFRTENFVLLTDADLQKVSEEWDTVLALSVTKWIQLNFGDAGLKRFFRRIYASLKPGGVFVLEPQPWPSYGKKRRDFTDTMKRHYKQIQLFPNQYREFLLNDVGFANAITLKEIDVAKGFERPIYGFFKLDQTGKMETERATVETGNMEGTTETEKTIESSSTPQPSSKPTSPPPKHIVFKDEDEGEEEPAPKRPKTEQPPF